MLSIFHLYEACCRKASSVVQDPAHWYAATQLSTAEQWQTWPDSTGTFPLTHCLHHWVVVFGYQVPASRILYYFHVHRSTLVSLGLKKENPTVLVWSYAQSTTAAAWPEMILCGYFQSLTWTLFSQVAGTHWGLMAIGRQLASLKCMLTSRWGGGGN